MDKGTEIELIRNLSKEDLQARFRAELTINPSIKKCDNYRTEFFISNFNTGFANVNVFTPDREVIFGELYPLENLPEDMKKRGIGVLALITTIQKLNGLYRFSDDYVVAHARASQEGEKHLQRLGINPQGTQIKEYCARLVDYGTSKGFNFQQFVV